MTATLNFSKGASQIVGQARDVGVKGWAGRDPGRRAGGSPMIDADHCLVLDAAAAHGAAPAPSVVPRPSIAPSPVPAPPPPPTRAPLPPHPRCCPCPWRRPCPPGLHVLPPGPRRLHSSHVRLLARGQLFCGWGGEDGRLQNLVCSRARPRCGAKGRRGFGLGRAPAHPSPSPHYRLLHSHASPAPPRPAPGRLLPDPRPQGPGVR